jgi:hypothetical protein
MTSQDSRSGEFPSPQQSVTLDRFDGICGARGIVATRWWKKRRNRRTIEPYETQDRILNHWRFSVDIQVLTLPISARRLEKETSYASDFARISVSPLTRWGSSSSLISSRSRRRSRFLSAAWCLYLGTMSPIRGRGRLELRVRMSRWGVCIRLPVFRKISISVFFASRWLRRKRRWLGSGVLRRNLDGQTLPAFLSAPAKNFAAPSRRHTSTEAVSANASFVAGAIRWLTHSILLRIQRIR